MRAKNRHLINAIFLLGALYLKVFLERVFEVYLGDPFLAMALLVALEYRFAGRFLVFLAVGVYEGFFSPSGVLSALIAGLVVVALKDPLLKRLYQETPYSVLLVPLVLLSAYRFTYTILIPYLLDLPLPHGWTLAFSKDVLLTTGWVVLFGIAMRVGRSEALSRLQGL